MNYTQKYLADLAMVAADIPDDLRGSRVVITGASGLIGSAVVDMLMAFGGVQVFAAGRDLEKLRQRFYHWEDRQELTFLPYDALTLPAWQENFDYYIHGASNATPGAYSSEPVQTLLANINGVAALLEYARNHGGKRLLYVSSSEVYGRSTTAEPYREDDYGFVDILNPRACYPSGKRGAETLCAAYTAQYGLDTVIVRPGHIYGPTARINDDRASSQFPRDALAGKDIVMKSAGTQLRSYCYVLDCAAAVLTVLLRGEPAKAYNISNKNSLVTIRQMAQAFADAAGVRLVFTDPTAAEVKSYNLMDRSDLDATRLEALGWQGRFDLDAGVKATLDAMK